MMELAAVLLVVLSLFVLALIFAWRRLYWLIVPHGIRAAAPTNFALTVVSWASVAFLLTGPPALFGRWCADQGDSAFVHYDYLFARLRGELSGRRMVAGFRWIDQAAGLFLASRGIGLIWPTAWL